MSLDIRTDIRTDLPSGARTNSRYGLAVHTCGRTIVQEALDLGRPVLDHVVAYYKRPRTLYYAHLVMGHDGRIVRLADDSAVCWHIGLDSDGRQRYLNGDWKTEPGKSLAVASWIERWPGVASPSHLYPSERPNYDYIGVEMTPISGRCAEAWKGGLFTMAQHDAVAELACSLAREHRWPSGWERSGRLVGHEDVTPLDRADSKGLWDPGAGRYFDWARVLDVVDRIQG